MSWCVADIVNIHGPVPLAGNPVFNPGATPLIFPDLQPGAPSVAGVEVLPPQHGLPPAGFPSGPFTPYPEAPPSMNLGVPPGGAPTTPPTSPAPGGYYPPGPPLFEARPPVEVPPPPPMGAGFGSSRRNPESIVVPRSPGPVVPVNAAPNGALAPPTIEPAMPPAGTGATPVAGPSHMPAAMAPPNYYPLPPPHPEPAAVAPAEYQQQITR
jgi:hypothetical protein